MKKRFLNLILIGAILIMLPIYISADSYSEAEDIVKQYLQKNEFKNSYSKYLYTNGTNNLSGMISKNEFEITRYDKNKNYKSISYSYLWDSNPFWSNTVENNKNIPIRENYEPLAGDDKIVKTKVTQYIKNNAGVYGSGTYEDPWLFAPQYRVRIKVNDTNKGYITDSNYANIEDEVDFVYTAGSGIQYIYIKSIGANEYLGSTCGYVVNGINANNKYEDDEGVGGYLLVSNITRDTECIINFGEKPRVIKLDQTYNDLVKTDPEVLYMSPEKGWYSDKYGNNQIVQLTKTPERLGYNFEGYYRSSNKDNACSGDLVIDKTRKLYTTRSVLNQLENNATIFACYEPITYYVAYDCTEGTGSMDKSTHVYDVPKPLSTNQCIRTGYDFNGWNTNSNGTGTKYDGKPETNVEKMYNIHEGTLQLYAMWKAKEDITYKVNHYIQNVNDTNYTLKETFEYEDGISDAEKTLNPNTYEGFTSPSKQTVIIKPDGSTVVNFYYTRKSYKITYNANGHGTPDPEYNNLKYQSNYKFPSISAKGYTLKGWFPERNNGTQITTSTTVEKAYDHTIYAKWEANKYTVKHSCGTGSGTVANITATFDQTFTAASNTCTKKGYTQIGWTTNSNETNDGYGWSNWSGTWKYVNGEYGIANGVLQLYPRWQANTYTVKYSCGNTTSQTATFNSSFTIASNTCTKKGYTQIGWTTNSNGSNDGHGWSNWSGTWTYVNGEYGIANGVLQLYPRWEANTYTIKYSCGTGSGSVSSQSVKYDASITIAKSGCTKDGYEFSGWTTRSDETNDGYNWTNWSGTWVYDNGQYNISNRTLQLYPMWSQCQAGYYSNNGTCQKCSAGTYSKAGAASCTVCAKGTYSSTAGATSCTSCPAGTYNTTTGNTTCTDCPKGKYCTGGTNTTNCPAGTYRNATGGKTESDCTACAAGKYSSAGATSCANCPAGKYNTGTGNTTCTDCPAGKYCTGGTNRTNCPAGTYRSSTGGKTESDCTACAAGKYSSAGATSCANCPAGKYNTTTGNSTCTDCPAGKYCTGGTNTTNCPVNTYRATTGGKTESDCAACAAGTYSAAGATSCASCPAGSYLPEGGTSCVTCPKGKYCTGGTNVTNCPAGTYRNATGGKAASDCTDCQAGTYSSAGATACTTCPAGKYNTTTGNSTCTACPKGKYCTGGTNTTNCPAGTYRNATGGKVESDCTACTAGTYSSAGAATCTTCPAGKYNTTTGNSTCTACPKGKYCTGGTNRTNCPAGTYRNATGGKVESDCTACAAGKYSSAGASTCTDCEAGKYSSAGATTCTTCPAGKYNTTTGNSTCTACPKGKYCTGGTNTTNCPAGTYRNATGGKVESDCTDCAAGTYSSAGASTCTTCPAGKYNTTAGNSTCTACPKGKYCTGGTNTTNCPANTYRSTTGGKAVSDCTACPTGKTSPAGSDASSDCTTPQVTYTATFNKNGASSIGSTSLSCTTDQGSTCTVKAPSITGASGFTVIGWNTSSSAITSSVDVGGTITLSSNRTYYAITRYNTSTYKTATFQVVDSSGTTRTSLTSTYSSNYGSIYKTVKCYRYNGSSSEYKCKAPTQIHIYARTEFSESLFDFGGWSTTKTNQSKAFGANEIFTITANKTYYQISTLKSVYYSSSVYGSSLGTNFRSSLTGSTFEGLNLGHRLQPSSWSFYTGESSCYNYIWIYGKSLNESWYGYGCSWYLGLVSRSAQ